MICVCIGRGRHRHMMAEHRHLVEQGAELVELRLDYIRGAVNVRRLLSDRPCPVIATCRREKDGGKFTGSETERKLILRTAVAEGVVDETRVSKSMSSARDAASMISERDGASPQSDGLTSGVPGSAPHSIANCIAAPAGVPSSAGAGGTQSASLRSGRPISRA